MQSPCLLGFGELLDHANDRSPRERLFLVACLHDLAQPILQDVANAVAMDLEQVERIDPEFAIGRHRRKSGTVAPRRRRALHTMFVTLREFAVHRRGGRIGGAVGSPAFGIGAGL